ncbi:unnamed protein product, partial [Rotaria sp. Silwood2]
LHSYSLYYISRTLFFIHLTLHFIPIDLILVRGYHGFIYLTRGFIGIDLILGRGYHGFIYLIYHIYLGRGYYLIGIGYHIYRGFIYLIGIGYHIGFFIYLICIHGFIYL